MSIYNPYGYPFFEHVKPTPKKLTKEEQEKYDTIKRADKATNKKIMRPDGRFV